MSANAPWIGDDLQGIQCRTHGQGYGPYDYLRRHQLPEELHIVERVHFTSTVEQLISGATSTNPLKDIHYTLNAWPNHHRALYSLIQYQISKGYKAMKVRSPAECYLQRAINFSPNDGTSQMLYGLLLHRINHREQALKQYQNALKSSPSSTQTKYNLGLLLMELGKFTEANRYAQELYSRGYPLLGLKNKLIQSGYWSETLAPKLEKSGGMPKVK